MLRRELKASISDPDWEDERNAGVRLGGRSGALVGLVPSKKLAKAREADLPVELDHLFMPACRMRRWWIFQSQVYSTDQTLDAIDVKALLLEAENKSRVRVARARALMEQAAAIDAPRRSVIPDEVKVLVWQRDKGVCVRCGSNRNLEFDHIIPFSMGGSNTARNLQLLCETCNRAKGGNLA